MNLILIQGRSQIGREEDKGEFEEGEMVQAEMETWKSLGHFHTSCMHCTQRLLSTIWKTVKKHSSQDRRLYKVKVKSLSGVQLFVVHQAPPSVGFSRQEYWSGLPFPSPEIFPTQGLNPGLPHCRQKLYRLSHQGSPYIVRRKDRV